MSDNGRDSEEVAVACLDLHREPFPPTTILPIPCKSSLPLYSPSYQSPSFSVRHQQRQIRSTRRQLLVSHQLLRLP